MAGHDCKKENDIDRLHDKLDKTNYILREMSVTLERNTVSLEEHMRRTKLLETALAKTNIQIAPLQKIYIFSIYFIKFCGYAGAVATFIYATIKFFV